MLTWNHVMKQPTGNNFSFQFRCVVIFLFMIYLRSYAGVLPIPDQIIGVKIYPDRTPIQSSAMILDFQELQINTVFCTVYNGLRAFYPDSKLPLGTPKDSLINFRSDLKSAGICFGTICPVFYDPDSWDQHPDWRTVDKSGNDFPDSWQKMICPSCEDYREFKLSIIQEVLEKFHPEFLILDFIRLPVDWEMITSDTRIESIREYCFCPRCRQKYAASRVHPRVNHQSKIYHSPEMNITSDDRQWINWRASLITSFVANVKHLVKIVSPSTKIVVQIVPWRVVDYEGGLLRIAGQDIQSISENCDFLSPMIYHRLIQQEVSYIRELTQHLFWQTGKPVLPSIQADDFTNPGSLSSFEFETALRMTDIAQVSAGVMIFNWGMLWDEKNGIQNEKCAILKQFASQKFGSDPR